MNRTSIVICCVCVVTLGSVGISQYLVPRRAVTKRAPLVHRPGAAFPLMLKPGEPFPPIPGDPQTVVHAFKRAYQAMVAFRKTHGRLPRGPELQAAIGPGPDLINDDFINPDALTGAYAASMPIQDEPHYARPYQGRRFNGQRKPAYPRKGERDLWLVSKHYLRRAEVGSGSHWHSLYFGVMVGLFSDGAVEVMPAEKLTGIRLARNAWQITFPDQSGIPRGACMPANQIQDAMLAALNRTTRPDAH